MMITAMVIGVDLFWPLYAAAVFGLLAAAAHIAAYRKTTRPVSQGRRYLLLSVRLAAIALLVFALWRPAGEQSRTLSRRMGLAILVDRSKSMSIGDDKLGDPAIGCTRFARASAVLDEPRDVWRRIGESYDVTAYSFAGGIEPLGAGWDEGDSSRRADIKPDGTTSAIGDAIEGASRVSPSPEVILVISDGLNNSGVDPLDAAIPGGATVFAIGVGQERPTASTSDVAAKGIYAPAEAFVDSPVTVVGSFSAAGVEGSVVKVHLVVDGEEKEIRELAVASKDTLLEARFDFKPTKAGSTRVEVKAEPVTGEILAINNSAATYVDVKKGRLKVLYIEGTFRWDARFFRLALEGARDIDVRMVIPGQEQAGDLGGMIDDEWDVLVIGDVPASALPAGSAAKIAERVVHGGRGVLFMGGAQGLGAGGYADTALAECVPFEISGADKWSKGLYMVSARPEGPYSRLVSLGPDESIGVWERVAPLLAANTTGEARAGASVLLAGLPVLLDGETGDLRADSSRRPLSVLGVEDYGKGRTAAMTGEGTWQWATGAGLSGTKERDEASALYEKFWRQLVFWLARREERGGVTVQLTLSSHRVDAGAPVAVEAQVLDGELSNLTDATVTAEITGPDTNKRQALRLEDGSYRGSFRPTAAGDYKVKVTATRSGQQAAEASTAFVASAVDAEFSVLVARHALLEAIARTTGGSFATADNAGEVLTRIQKLARLTEYSRLERTEIWSTWIYVSLVITLLAVEWGLRKLSGLV